MAVSDHPLLTEEEFDRLVTIVPKLTATQLWNLADTFGRRIVALPNRGGNGAESDTVLADQDTPRELSIGFRA